jgi:hypothetical protein
LIARIASIAAFLMVVAGTGFVHARIPSTTDVERGEAFVPDPALTKAFSLGFDAVLADYYWLQAVQAVGGQTQPDAEMGSHLGKLIDLVTTLNPRVDHPYRFAAIWLTESEEVVRTANRLLRRSFPYHPEEWRNRFYLGFNYFYYLLDNEQAAAALEEASALPGSPPYLPRLVARLNSATTDIDVAEVFLLQMVEDARDRQTRAGYQAALDEIEVEKKARFLDQARRAFEKLNGRDIMSVDELVSGPHPILAALPSPEPDALPAPLSRGSVWKLDFESDEIISTYYDSRYVLHSTGFEHERAKEWKQAREERAAIGASGEQDPNGKTEEEMVVGEGRHGG